jgi:hypothetical protein
MFNGNKYVFYQGEYILESELDEIMDRSGSQDMYYD